MLDTAIVTLVGSAIGAGFGSWQNSRKARRQIDDEVLPEVERVRILAEPTGDGFAALVTNGIADISRRLDRMETTLVDHLHEHSALQIARDLREIREER